MTGCSVHGCTNSSDKGFLMRKFPRDPVRRQQWTVIVKQDGWQPTDNSRVCEIHFAPEMWEKPRVDGKRKLKGNAVPTISADPAIQKKSKTLHPLRCASEKSNVVLVILPNTFKYTTGSEAEPQPTTSCVAAPSEPNLLESRECKIESDLNVDRASEKCVGADLTAKLLKYKSDYSKVKKMAKMYRNVLRNLGKKLKANRHAVLKQVFTSDQILALKRKTPINKSEFLGWSSRTIEKAIELKSSCGHKGYLELLKQGYPLPSINSLKKIIKTHYT